MATRTPVRLCCSGSRSRAATSISLAGRSYNSTTTKTTPALVSTKRPAPNPLAKIITDSIKITGPVSVARYMQMCLTHPTEGYYSKGEVFGSKGDFITSPEISQIFGELMAIYYLTRWMASSGKKVRLVELGPGRGTLMDDMLRTLFAFPTISNEISSIILVENSEHLQKIQGQKLEARLKGKQVDLSWVDKIEDIPESEDVFTIVMAHEFFDAMPVNVFEKRGNKFEEVMVDIDPAYDHQMPTTAKSPFRLAISREPTPLSQVLPTTSSRFPKLPEGGRVEISQESWKVSRKVGQLIGKGGAGLYVDYGGPQMFGNSFRGFRNHQIVDIFDQPGSSDLTANVDFSYLSESLDTTGSKSHGPIPQSQFLLALGLEPRMAKLLASAEGERKEDIRKGATRLIDTLGMGSQYQIMGIEPDSDGEVYPFLPAPASTPAPAPAPAAASAAAGSGESTASSS